VDPEPLGTGGASVRQVQMRRTGDRQLLCAVGCAEFDINEVDFKFLFRLDANEKGTSFACRDYFVWVVHTLEQQGVRALKFPHNKLSKLREVDIALLLVEDVLCEFRNTFGVGLSFKNVSLILKHGFQFSVVGDNSVVHDYELGLRIAPACQCIFTGKETCEDGS
jgi:hypothetical protein